MTVKLRGMSMHRLYFFIIVCIAIACVALIAFSMWQEANKPEEQEPTAQAVAVPDHSISEPPSDPASAPNPAPASNQTKPTAPFKSYIAAVGIVEASSENIFIGAPVQRVVEKVLVSVGADVKKGDVLIQLENRDLQAELASRLVAYDIALAKVKRLEAMPRPEEVASAEAAFKIAQTELAQAQSQYEMTQGLRDSRAISQEEINKRRSLYQQAEAKLQQAKVNLDKVKAGTWKPDLEIARLEAWQAKAHVDRIKADIERTVIRSPIDGKVLQVKIHEGEYPPGDTFRMPMMIVGNVNEKHLSVSINQYNTGQFSPEAAAVAFLPGNTKTEFPIEFVKLEPFLTYKQTVTSDIKERVDTRVLQATYRFKENPQNIFVGQQMDVFIETKEEEKS
jgi:HlyD family secretion protein